MSSIPNRASNPTDRSRKPLEMIDLTTARSMLPLVRSIVSDIVISRQRIAELAPEQQRLERHRRDLIWPDRRRRYQINDEIAAAEQTIYNATLELTKLGVNLVDSDSGEVDFPTRVNGRPAAFIWRLGDDDLHNWRYLGEEQLHPIPAEWEHSGPVARLPGQP